MGCRCFVPFCTSGYGSNAAKVSFFKAPKELMQKWNKIILRKDRQLSPRSRVCEKHFQPEDIIRVLKTDVYTIPLMKPKLKHGALPSVFPECPKYLSSKSKKRSLKCENLADNLESETRIETIFLEESIPEEEIDIKPSTGSFFCNVTDSLENETTIEKHFLEENVTKEEIDIKQEEIDIKPSTSSFFYNVTDNLENETEIEKNFLEGENVTKEEIDIKPSTSSFFYNITDNLKNETIIEKKFLEESVAKEEIDIKPSTGSFFYNVTGNLENKTGKRILKKDDVKPVISLLFYNVTDKVETETITGKSIPQEENHIEPTTSAISCNDVNFGFLCQELSKSCKENLKNWKIHITKNLILIYELIVYEDNVITKKKIVIGKSFQSLYIFEKKLKSDIFDNVQLRCVDDVFQTISKLEKATECYGGLTIGQVPKGFVSKVYNNDIITNKMRHTECPYIIPDNSKMCNMCKKSFAAVRTFRYRSKSLSEKFLKNKNMKRRENRLRLKNQIMLKELQETKLKLDRLQEYAATHGTTMNMIY